MRFLPTFKVAVMTGRERLVYRILLGLGFTLTAFFLIWWFQPEHISRNFYGYLHGIDILLFILVTYVVWYQIVNECFAWYIAGFMRHPKERIPQNGLHVAFLTAFVPGKEPYDMLEQTLSAMVKADYPHDTWLLDEGDNPRAKDICRNYDVKYFTRKGSLKYNTPEGPYKRKTKGGNYNAWFDQHGRNYEFVAQLDVDFVPRKDYLVKTLGYFSNPDIAFVGTPQIYGNTDDSWIARGAAEQAYNFYGSMQKGLFGADMTLLIGANHVLRVAAHSNIQGYSGHIVEDHLTGMRLYSRRWKSVYVPEVLAVGEGPSTLEAYFSQQTRWAYGLIDILFRHSPKFFPSMKRLHALNYFVLQQYYFYGLAQVAGIFLLCLYFFFGIEITSMKLGPLLALYIPLLIFQQIFFVWLQRFNIDPKNEHGLMLRGKILNWIVWPIYFLAFVGVFLRKKIIYVVTSKGKQDNSTLNMSLFYPHLVLGTLTFFCLAASVYSNRQAPQLVFWAIVNTVVMYGFIIIELCKVIRIFPARLSVLKVSLLSISLFLIVALLVQVTNSARAQATDPVLISPLPSTDQTGNHGLLSNTSSLSTDLDATLETHTVLTGENLWKISKKYFGKGSDWKKIQTNNESTIIHPGEVLTLPKTPESQF